MYITVIINSNTEMDLSEIVKIGLISLFAVLLVVILIPVIYGMISRRQTKRAREAMGTGVQDLHTLAKQAGKKKARRTGVEHNAQPIHLRTGEHHPRQEAPPQQTRSELPQIIINEPPPPPPPPPPKKQVDWRQQWN